MMTDLSVDAVARGVVLKKPHIAGRPRPGLDEKYVFLQEPEEPVQMHWKDNQLLPHYRKNCPYCDGRIEIKPMWYIGSVTKMGDPVMVELTHKCFEMASSSARYYGEGKFTGLLVRIGRRNLDKSPRWLRCDQRLGDDRLEKFLPWPYETRRELARIWGIPIKPRLYQVEEA